MLKFFTSHFLRTVMIAIAVFMLHTLSGSISSSAANIESAGTEASEPISTSLLTDSNDNIDDFGLISEGCSLPHTSLARPSSNRTNVPNSIAKHVLANWNVLSKIINNLYSPADCRIINTGISYAFSCEYYIFALRKILI